MDTQENKNYNKLAFIILEIVTKHLRHIFRQEWNNQHSSNHWQDDSNSLSDLETETKKLRAWNKSKAPTSGDLKDWDPTNLFYVLLYSKTINLSSADKEEIDTLRKIRNQYFAHPSNASISDTDFKAICLDIKMCMINLNCSNLEEEKIEDIKNEIVEVPEDYLKENEAKLLVIQMVVTENNQLLTQVHYLLRKYGCIIIFLLLVILGMLVLNQTYNPIHSSTITTCNNSRSFFPELWKPGYYIGHDWEITKGANVLANGSYPMVSITGPLAVGKTATAIAVGQVLKNNHGYQVAFDDLKQINLSSSHIKTDIYKGIVLSIDGYLENVPNSLPELKLLLIKMTTCPTLLVLDNIENIVNSTSNSILQEVIKECMAISCKIRILATSQKEFDIIGVSIYQIKLETLTQSQSTALLSQLLPGVLQKNLIMKITEKTGGIPLLLELSASLVRSKLYTESDLMKRFEELPVLVILNNTKDMTDKTNYYKLLKIIYDGFDPSVQVSFIIMGTISLWLSCTSANDDVIINFIDKVDVYPLINYNLLKTVDMPNGQRSHTMNPVIIEFTRLVAEDNSHSFECLSVSVDYGKANIVYFFHDYSDYSDMTLQQPKWNNQNLPKIMVGSGLTERDKRFCGTSAFHKGLEFYDLGQYNKTLGILRKAIELVKDDNIQLKPLLKLVLMATNKTQGNLSINFSNLVFKTLNSIEKDDPCFVAMYLFNLGRLFNDTKLYKDAMYVVKNALSNYQRENHDCRKEDLVLWALNLAKNFYNLVQYHESLVVLQLISANHLKSHVNQLEADYILAVSFYETQDYESCFKIVRRVLNTSYEVDYNKKKHVFQILISLALEKDYHKQSDFTMDIQFSVLSLNTLKKLKTDSCVVALLYFYVGAALYKQRTLYCDAAFAFNQTWTFLKQGTCKQDLGSIAYHLGVAYYYCGQYNNSIDVLRTAVDLLEKDDILQFKACNFLAFCYYEIQQHEKSYELISNIYSKYFYTHSSLLSYVEDLVQLTRIAFSAAIEYQDQGNLNESIAFYNLTIAIHELACLPSCEIASMYSVLGSELLRAQRLADALYTLKMALVFYQQSVCDDEEILHRILAIVKLLFVNNQYNKCIEVLLRTSNLLKNPNHQFEANYRLAISYFVVHDYKNCSQLLSKIFDSSYINKIDRLMYKEELQILRKLEKYSQPHDLSAKYDKEYIIYFLCIICNMLSCTVCCFIYKNRKKTILCSGIQKLKVNKETKIKEKVD